MTNLRVHYKNTRETVMALRGMTLRGAQRYLAQVLDHKAAIPFRRHTGGIGRAPQAKIYNTTQVRWPKKSVEAIQQLLSNAASNADVSYFNMIFFVSYVCVVDSDSIDCWESLLYSLCQQESDVFSAISGPGFEC